MSSVKFSKDWWGGRLDSEAKYASGSHANDEHACQKLSTIVSMEYPKSYSDSMFPLAHPIKDKLESNDDGIFGAILCDGGIEIKDGDRDDFVQSTFYLDKVLAQIASGQGSLPPSYSIHWQDHIKKGDATDNYRYESYGCYVKKLTFSIPEASGFVDGFPYWKITDTCYNSKYDTGVGTNVDSLDKTFWKSLSNSPLSVRAGYTINNEMVYGTSADLEIDLNYDETLSVGDLGVKHPYFIGANVKFTTTFRSYTQFKNIGVNALKNVDGNQLYSIKINTGLTGVFIQLTNMRVSEASLNRIPEYGLAKYDLVFLSTANTVISKLGA